MKKILLTVLLVSVSLGTSGCLAQDAAKQYVSDIESKKESLDESNNLNVNAAVQNTNNAIATWVTTHPTEKTFDNFILPKQYDNIDIKITGTPKGYVITATGSNGYSYSFDSTTGQYK